MEYRVVSEAKPCFDWTGENLAEAEGVARYVAEKTGQNAEVVPLCPDCGGLTRIAFATTDTYISCRRCGHVHANPLRESVETDDGSGHNPNHPSFETRY